MSRKNIEDAYPLSPIQESMIFYNLLDDSGVNTSQLACRLEDLQVEMFKEAWQRIIERHAILRTAFVWKVGRPLQVVGRKVALPLEELDWTNLSPDSQQEKLATYIDENRRRNFNPAKAPLMRLALIRLDHGTYAFIWSHHHLLLDGWSKHIIIKELLELYDALKRNEQLTFPPVRPYHDYIVWLQQQDAARAEAFWRENLKGFTTPTPLNFDHARTDTAQRATPSYEEVRLPLSHEMTKDLQAFARGHQLTLNTVVQGAWALLLSRYSGESDIVFGAVSAQRPAEIDGIESMVGLFINTLPVRVRIDEEMKLDEWLRQLQAQQAEMRQFEYSSLVEVQGWSEVPRGVPLFESLLAFENYPVDAALREPNLALQISNFTNVERSSYPLSLVAAPGRELSLKLIYDRSCYDSTTPERMLGHIERLLREMLTDAERPLARLGLLTEDERHRHLVRYNDTAADYPRKQCLHELFESQVQRTPAATAVVFGEEKLTYKELNSRSNQLAHYLLALGIRTGVRVAICLRHSPEMLVAVLGVLKAGAAYVPLDPSHPRARYSFMIEDAATPVLLTEQALAQNLPQDGVTQVCLDTDWPTIATHNVENPNTTVTAEDIAYVIYTSGSTGEPKGVMVRHCSVVNYIWWAIQKYLAGESHDFALYSSLSFDLTVTSIYTPLLTGNTVFIYRQEGRETPLLDILKDDRVGVIKLTPSHLHVMAEVQQRPSRLRRLIVGGEALETSLARKIHENFGGEVEIYNEYGPTEATVGCMIHQFDSAKDNRAFVPIGKPAANTQLYVLDENLEPVAENVVSELYISGDGVAAGYLNREQLTRERFIANPFIADQVMYDSGDLVRRLSGDILEYVGRRDEQVKFHGYRVELNEIRSALNSHAQVRDSIVKVVKDDQGHDVLVAYYVSRQELEPGQLRELLRESIAEEIIPNIFVHLKKMPLTLNGKINHRALPTIDEARERARREYVAARNETEEILSAIWADVLHVSKVGVEDNFFELGGHSLLAVQVISRIRAVCNVEMPLRSLFEARTVSALARKVEETMRAGRDETLPPIVPVPRDGGNLALSFAQQRLWFLNELAPNRSLYNVSLAVRMHGKLNTQALEQSLREIVRRHEVLRTSFPTVDHNPVQVIAPAIDLKLPVVWLTHLPESLRETEIRGFVDEDARLPFKLAEAPLLRLHLLCLGAEDHMLVCTIHHIVSDGWTIGVIVRELGALYDAFTHGRPSPLAPLAVQYADFAAWQREWLRGEVLDQQLEYWKKQLSGAGEQIELPTDRPGPAVPTYEGASTSFTLTGELVNSLRTLSQREGVTLFMTMLAAFQCLLHRYSGSDDISVGSPIANRSRPETEGLIGCFINTLVLRANLAGNPTFKELLGRVREVTLGAYAHQDVPFEVLVEALQPERKNQRTPLFQVWLVLNNVSRQRLELPGLTLNQINRTVWNAHFDLTLSLTEYEDGIEGTLTYNTTLFDADTAATMTVHFQSLLESVAAHPETRILDIPLERTNTADVDQLPAFSQPEQLEDHFNFSTL